MNNDTDNIDELAKACRGEFDESGGMYFDRKAWGFFCEALRENKIMPEAFVPTLLAGDDRIKQLMQQAGSPNSLSLYLAFKQFENEMQIEAAHKKPKIDWAPLQEFWRSNSSADWGSLEQAVNDAIKVTQ